MRVAIIEYVTAHRAHELQQQGWVIVHLFGRVWRAITTAWITLPTPTRPFTRPLI